MRRPSRRDVLELLRFVVVGLAGIAIVMAAAPVATAVGGVLGIFAGFFCIALGLIVVQFME